MSPIAQSFEVLTQSFILLSQRLVSPTIPEPKAVGTQSVTMGQTIATSTSSDSNGDQHSGWQPQSVEQHQSVEQPQSAEQFQSPNEEHSWDNFKCAQVPVGLLERENHGFIGA